MKTLLLHAFALFILSSHALAYALAGEPIFVVAAKTHAVRLERNVIKDIFQAKKRKLDDWHIEVVDQASPSETREQFYRSLLNKSSVEMNVYWAELVFSGNARAPTALQNDQSVIDYLQTHPNAIGYVHSKSSLPENVVVVYQLE